MNQFQDDKLNFDLSEFAQIFTVCSSINLKEIPKVCFFFFKKAFRSTPITGRIIAGIFLNTNIVSFHTAIIYLFMIVNAYNLLSY